MKTAKAVTIISILFFSITAYAGETPPAALAKGCAVEQGNALMQGYCGRDALRAALAVLRIETAESHAALKELTGLADTRKGYNTLLEIKQAAEKAGLQAEGVRYSGKTVCRTERGMQSLRLLKETGEVIVNITGNRHFALIRAVDEAGVRLYIPGLNYSEPRLSWEEFARTWDGAALVISPSSLRGVLSLRAGRRSNLTLVSDSELARIYGGQPCGNVNGGAWKYDAGTGGCVRGSSGNGSAQNNSDSSMARPAAATEEPVALNNGNLFLTAEDIGIPTRGFPLKLKRYYNAQVVSEVTGWLPEAGAGSWVIENGEYSGQGNRSTSDLSGADYTVELDMQTIQPGASHTWETAWVHIRYVEDPNDPRKPKDCYYFLIHTNGKIELGKWKGGTQSFPYNKATNYRPVNKNRVKIIAAGANIKVYINGVLEINYTDNNNPVLSAGRVALESYFSHSHFDNVTISAGTQSYSYNFNTDDNEFIFGYGWTHSYGLRLKEYPNHVTLYRENNAREIYIPTGSGAYTTMPVNYYSKLTKDTSGFSLKDKYGAHYRFNLSGQLQYIQDRNGSSTTLSYSNIGGKSLPTAIIEPAGRKITLSYGSNNMVSTAADPAGNQLQYYYDAFGHLTEARDRNGNTTSYEYDPVTHNLVKLTDSAGNGFNYSYIYNDRVNDQSDPLGNTTRFDYLWSTVHVINEAGKIYKYNFDGKGFLQSVTDPNGRIERGTNDANGNITAHYDKNARMTTYTYDTSGNPTVLKDANSNSRKFSYNTFSLPTNITDEKGSVTTLTYDTKGNLTKSVNAEGGGTAFTYNAYGQVISRKDPKGNLTQYTYDSCGNLSSVKDALSNITIYSYDILGRVTGVKDAMGNIYSYTYDANGNLLTVRDPLGNVTGYTYTELDKLSTVTDPLGNSASYSYDCFGNLLSTSDAMGNNISYSYDTTNQMHLNQAGLISIIDANGSITGYTYDALGRLIQETDAQGQIAQYSYDAQGNLIQRKDAQGQTTKYQYDNLNRLSKITYPDNSAVTYTYDAVSSLTQMQDTTGITKYTFDKIKRMKSQTYPDGTILTYTYDANNNQTSLSMSGTGNISYTYDTLNRLNKITQPDGKTALFNYDQLFRRIQLNYPNGAVTTYGYDQASRLTQLINKNKSAQEISKYSYAYNTAGDRTKVTAHNGSVTYAYDKNRQLIQEFSSVEGTSINNDYTYDSAGNRLVQKTSSSPENYSYNTLNQLISQSSGSAQQKYTQITGTVSDTSPVSVKVNGITATISNGKWTTGVSLKSGQNTIVAEATDAAGNKSSKQIKVTYNAAPAASITYTYDKNGNLIQKKNGSTTETYTYDYENRLKSYASSTQSASYAYNGHGQRISKTVNGTTTKYYYDGDEVILEKTGATVIYYIHGPRVDEIISDSRGYCYHTDGLGSVVNLTDSAGAKANSYTYLAFGKTRNQAGTVANPWLFTGRQYDAESGLYYYRSRYYDPRTGRFISRDPIGIAGGINLYLYCGNDPVNRVDPWGLSGTILIHSYEGRGGSLDGHSWIEYRKDNGTVTTYGTYGNNNGAQRVKGLNINTELDYPSGTTRQTHISNTQEAILTKKISGTLTAGENAWTLLNPCSDFASDTWKDITKEGLQDRNWMGISNPSILSDSIKAANGGTNAGLLNQQTQPHSSKCGGSGD